MCPRCAHHREAIKNSFLVIEETFKQFNVGDVSGIEDDANVGLALKGKFHVASYLRTPSLYLPFALFSRNCSLLEVKNGTRHRYRAQHPVSWITS